MAVCWEWQCVLTAMYFEWQLASNGNAFPYYVTNLHQPECRHYTNCRSPYWGCMPVHIFCAHHHRIDNSNDELTTSRRYSSRYWVSSAQRLAALSDVSATRRLYLLRSSLCLCISDRGSMLTSGWELVRRWGVLHKRRFLLILSVNAATSALYSQRLISRLQS